MCLRILLRKLDSRKVYLVGISPSHSPLPNQFCRNEFLKAFNGLAKADLHFVSEFLPGKNNKDLPGVIDPAVHPG